MEGLQLDPALSAPTSRLRGPARALRLRRFLEGPHLLLAAVAAVVVLVSLPLLRGLAVRENERDAIRTLRLFGREVFAGSPSVAAAVAAGAGARALSAGAPSPGAATLGALVERDESLIRRLPDARLVDDGRRLFRHGYLFELARGEDGSRLLRAWPYSHGETGLAAFVLGPDGALYGNVNRAARWSGPASPPEANVEQLAAGEPDWRLLRADLGASESR